MPKVSNEIFLLRDRYIYIKIPINIIGSNGLFNNDHSSLDTLFNQKPIIMAGTYSKNYIHIVFAVRNRQNLIDQGWEDRLYMFITGLVQNKGQKMLAINGMPDHIHILIGMQPSCCLSDLVREIKKSSNNFINEHHLCIGKFNWQSGFGSFTYGHSQLEFIIPYIMNQKQHHLKRTFQAEYLDFLKKYEVDYDDRFLFDWFE